VFLSSFLSCLYNIYLYDRKLFEIEICWEKRLRNGIYLYFIVVVNKTDYMYIKTLAAQQGCKTLTVACLKHKTV